MKIIKNILKLLFVTFVSLALFFCGKYIYQQYIVNQTEEDEIIKVACVGDSLTFRRSYTEELYNYSDFLGELLGENYEVTNYGMAGTCLQANTSYPYTSTRVYLASVEAEADIIIIMLGTNDIWYDRWQDEETFYQYYIELIDSYLQTENTPEIYLCTIPYIYSDKYSEWDVDYNGRGDNIRTIIRQISEERGYHLIEMEQITMDHPEWYEEDGLHFNYEGAIGISKIIYNAIIKG